MPLSRYTDYAYRVLLYVGANDKRCTLNEVSEFYDISVEHLRKVVHTLGLLSYIRTYQGKNGGFEINIDPEDIHLGAVYREFEMDRGPIINCKQRKCVLTPCCRLTSILLGAEQALIDELDKHTLKDLINRPSLKLLKAANI